MPKMRGIKPEILTDEKVVSLTPLSRWLFIGMWMYACDNGHIEDSPVQLKMRILPMDECDVNALLGEQINLGLVAREDGYLRVTNLPKHQNIDKRYLLLCDRCEIDKHSVYTEGDRVFRKRARSVPGGQPEGSQGVPATEGEGEGEGENVSLRYLHHHKSTQRAWGR